MRLRPVISVPLAPPLPPSLDFLRSSLLPVSHTPHETPSLIRCNVSQGWNGWTMLRLDYCHLIRLLKFVYRYHPHVYLHRRSSRITTSIISITRSHCLLPFLKYARIQDCSLGNYCRFAAYISDVTRTGARNWIKLQFRINSPPLLK